MNLQVGYSGDFYVESYGGKLTILSYEGKLDEVRIPSEIDGYVVSRIDKGAFKHDLTKGLRKVAVPVGVDFVEEDSFADDIQVVRYFNRLMGGFEYQSMWIIDPYLDETGRFSVDPLDYYGIFVEND